jgi:APA family basic amino acid/polyamine antiporter
VLVCIGVMVLRYKEPERPRPFRVPFVWVLAPLGAAACAFVMYGLPRHAWERFAIWLAIGAALYFAYGFRNSTLRRGAGPVAVEPPPPIEKR